MVKIDNEMIVTKESCDMYVKGEKDKAFGIFNAKIRKLLNDPKFWVTRGEVLLEEEKYSDAIEYFDQAIEIDPKDTEAWTGKGYSSLNMGRHKEALECVNHALENNSQNWNAWDLKGYTLYSTGEFKEALKCYDRIVKRKRDVCHPRNFCYYRGLVLLKLGRQREALKEFESSLCGEDNRHFLNAEMGTVEALCSLKKIGKAINFIDESINFRKEELKDFPECEPAKQKEEIKVLQALKKEIKNKPRKT
jgi:tetratricopeptide (TPR) repeat protein